MDAVGHFQLEIEPPRSGWMVFSFRCGGAVLSVDASYTPTDSFERLIDAADFLLGGFRGERAVTFNEEPAQVDLLFAVSRDDARHDVTVRATRHSDHRREIGRGVALLDDRYPAVEVARAIAVATRSVVDRTAEEAFSREWRRPFPRDALARLEATLRGRA